MQPKHLELAITSFLRLALSASFLSAVADRFGLWGAPGSPGVAWGNFENFVAYTGVLLGLVPTALVPLFAWVATIAETVLGIALIAHVRTREVAFASGVLLASFGVSMVISVGAKAPLDYSVFTASAAAFALMARVTPSAPRTP